MTDPPTTEPDWWDKHSWVSYCTTIGYAKCSKCGEWAMSRDLNEKCDGKRM